jgi:hypothetical protein
MNTVVSNAKNATLVLLILPGVSRIIYNDMLASHGIALMVLALVDDVF